MKKVNLKKVRLVPRKPKEKTTNWNNIKITIPLPDVWSGGIKRTELICISALQCVNRTKIKG